MREKGREREREKGRERERRRNKRDKEEREYLYHVLKHEKVNCKERKRK